MMIFLVASLLAISLGCPSMVAAEQLDRPFELRIVSRSGNRVYYRLRLSDLEFRITAYLTDDGFSKTIYADSILTPSPFLLQTRADLVPLLEHAITSEKGPERSLIRQLAFCFLPHIDDPNAAALFVRLMGTRVEDEWRCNLPDKRPGPDDSQSPPVWYRHVVDKRVLQTVATMLEHERADTTMSAPYDSPLWILRLTDSPDALALLREHFEKSRGHWAAEFYSMFFRDKGHGIEARPWSYLSSEILPALCADPSLDEDIFCIMGIWVRLCDMAAEDFIKGFSRDRVTELGELYLDNLIWHPEFDSIVIDDRDRQSHQLTDQEFLDSHWQYCSLLGVAGCFGTQRQRDRLELVLDRFESVFLASEPLGAWGMGSGAFGGPTREEAVRSYRQTRAAAFLAMASRTSNLLR